MTHATLPVAAAREGRAGGAAVVDALTRTVIGIICGAGGRTHVLDVLMRYNEMLFRGDALCTDWAEARLVVGGREYGSVVCGSVMYVLDYLASTGAVRLGGDGSVELVDRSLCRSAAEG